ncbi:hypothetical protein B0H14DRAFT_2626590 [Mycena olivaceomarginata]|nr:hypothetical protein B0H14DRAFT_2626590 [Mycena olivaceomarginata]
MTPPRPRSPSVSSDDNDAQYFCSFCDTCPTCGTDPNHMPVPHRDQAIPLPAVRERILPDIPIALPFTLFILETAASEPNTSSDSFVTMTVALVRRGALVPGGGANCFMSATTWVLCEAFGLTRLKYFQALVSLASKQTPTSHPIQVSDATVKSYLIQIGDNAAHFGELSCRLLTSVLRWQRATHFLFSRLQMPPRQTRCIKCLIPHMVPNSKYTAHLQEIQQGAKGLANTMSALTLTQPTHVAITPPTVAPDPPPLPSEPDRLSNLLTALVIADDDPLPYHQPSKLFSSRAEVQEMIAPEIPSTFHPISTSEATRSISTLVTHQMPVSQRKEHGKAILVKIQQDVGAALESLGAGFDKEKARRSRCHAHCCWVRRRCRAWRRGVSEGTFTYENAYRST